jgi:histidine ammonia-lyase
VYHFPWAALAPRRVVPMAENATSIIAIELLAAAQGCHFHEPLKSSQALENVRAVIRERVAFMSTDRYIHPDLVAAGNLVRERRIIEAVRGIAFPDLNGLSAFE